MKTAIVVGLFCGAMLLDQAAADLLARPIRSGQLQGVLRAMRCWGEGATLVLLSAGIALAHPAGMKRLLAVLVVTLICAGVVDLIKPIFSRGRPEESVAHSGLTWFTAESRNSSFPSGHTTTAFAFARGISMAYPAITPVCVVAASGTAVSRMYERRHFLSDCVAGGLLGWFLSGRLLLAMSKLEARWRWPARQRKEISSPTT